MKSTFPKLLNYAKELLLAAGVFEDDAEKVARALVTADAWKRGSHGLLRLPYYLGRIVEGGIDPKAKVTIVSDFGPSLSLDGNKGIGHSHAYQAAELARERAMQFGISAVSVGNSNHCGALGIYVADIASHGYIGLAFSNGPAVMPPWQGHSPVVSTSPLAAAFPIDPRPIIVDLATSNAARGKIAEAASLGQEIPDGWALDKFGKPTNNPTVALAGMLAPMGGAKGFALALMVEALTGAMIGPNLATEVADPLSAEQNHQPQGIGHLFIVLDGTKFDVDKGSKSRLSALASSLVKAGGRIPGSNKPTPKELANDYELEVAESTWAALVKAAISLGVDSPKS